MPRDSAEPESQVPVWREAPARPAQSVDHQRIPRALSDRLRLGQGSLTRPEAAAVFRTDVAPVGGAAAVVDEAADHFSLARWRCASG